MGGDMARHVMVIAVLLATPFRGVSEDGSAVECTGFAENQWWPVKGGIATIGDGIFVGVNTRNNEVRIQTARSSGAVAWDEWTGKPSDQREVVVVFERKVRAWSELPASFDLSKAILVSFEADRVRVFDFGRARGGFFARSAASKQSAPVDERTNGEGTGRSEGARAPEPGRGPVNP